MSRLWFEPFSVGRDVVLLAGIAGRNENGQVVPGVANQTRTILAQTEILLGHRGLDRRAVGRVRIYLVDVADWPTVRSEIQTFFGVPSPPCTAVAAVALVEPEMLVEIECEAFLERNDFEP